MTHDSNQNRSPEDVAEEVTTALEGSSDSQLREIIHYAQQLLRNHLPLTDAIESRKGEELVRMEDHGAYTIVVVERPDDTGDARGPFAYRVKWEPNIDEEGVSTDGTTSEKSTVTPGATEMTNSFFKRVVVPVANPDDAEATAATLIPYVKDMDSTVVVVHVIEKAGGAPDKASVEQREQAAQDIFAAMSDGLSDTGITLETKILYGTDIASTVIDAAHEVDASAIVFTPRGGSRWRKLLTGDVTHNLVNNTDVPILVLSDREAREE